MSYLRGDFSAAGALRGVGEAAVAEAAAAEKQRAAPSVAQLCSVRLFWDGIVRPQSGGFTHICQESRTFRDKANDAGDNAEQAKMSLS